MDEPARTALTVVSGAGVGIARADFLAAFGEGVAQEHLHLGRVFGPIDTEVPNYVSFRGRVSAIIRGDEKSTHRHCEVCNAPLYHPMGTAISWLAPKASPT